MKKMENDKKQTIMILEDDEDLAEGISLSLNSKDLEFILCRTIAEAKDRLQQRAFDLLIFDINLPDGNGYELCKLVKAEAQDTLVFFLTANDQEREQVQGYKAGAIDYITKPFSVIALQHKISAMLAMVENHKPFEDIYDDGKLCLDFARQTGTIAGKK